MPLVMTWEFAKVAHQPARLRALRLFAFLHDVIFNVWI
jgi:hypothetical protein